jgi:hypothetical protein
MNTDCKGLSLTIRVQNTINRKTGCSAPLVLGAQKVCECNHHSTKLGLCGELARNDIGRSAGHGSCHSELKGVSERRHFEAGACTEKEVPRLLGNF